MFNKLIYTVVSVLSSTLAQAPGDGDTLCVEPFINGNASQPNPFFVFRPVYPANIEVLMDSKDYRGLLQGNSPVWQQVDNDNNNTDQFVTSVSERQS